MAGYFSKTAYDRLPASVKKLSKDAQTVCIYLRLRKDSARIALETGRPRDETDRLVKEVQRTLICSGNYDIIADPVFVSLDALHENGRGMEPAAAPDAPENRLMLEQFLSALKAAISSLATAERRILHLYFERQMTGSQIFEFFRKSRLTMNSDAAPGSESDVYYFIERALKKLLSLMADSTPIGRGTLTVKGLKEVLAQTGVKEVA
jgi:DNA-directed RNA polymerase specialized sigma24 family protein